MRYQTSQTCIPAAIMAAIVITASADIRQNTSAYLDKYRKGGFVLTIKSADGKPLQGAIVAVEQTKHDYRFGAAIDYRITSSGYWDAAKKCFNICVEENAMNSAPGHGTGFRRDQRCRACVQP